MSSKKQQEEEEGTEKIPKTKQNQNKTKTATEKVEQERRRRWEDRAKELFYNIKCITYVWMFVH